MKNTHLSYINASFYHWNQENRMIFKAGETPTETPKTETVTGQDIINAASVKNATKKWKTDWKLVNILRKATNINTFRTQEFTLDTVSTHIKKQEFLEKLKKIAEKKEKVREKSADKRGEIVGEIRKKAERQAAEKATVVTAMPNLRTGQMGVLSSQTDIGQAAIDSAKISAAEPRVEEFTKATRTETVYAPKNETENFAEGQTAIAKLLTDLNGAVTHHSEAVGKLSRYQWLTDRIKLDESNIATLFGIRVKSDEGIIGLFRSGNDSGELAKLIEEKFPKTQDKTDWKNFAKEFGIFAGKSGMATALANSINYLIEAGNPNVFFAIAKLGEIDTGIQSGHLSDSIKETDLLFLGEFMRLSKIIEKPKNPEEKTQAKTDLQKLVADEAESKTNYTLIAENIALSSQALETSKTDITAVQKSINETLEDG
ncbi:hypothetical protein HZA41_02410, partial [Candidatus Peregrinibacteria bacterium]|nr:hypothetical protein [Candidatus Peregrinibacteria bacterium]